MFHSSRNKTVATLLKGLSGNRLTPYQLLLDGFVPPQPGIRWNSGLSALFGFVRGNALNNGALFASLNWKLDLFSAGALANVQFLLQDKSFLHHEDFFEDRNDCHVGFRTDVRGAIDDTIDGHTGYLDGFFVKRGLGKFFHDIDNGADTNFSSRDHALVQVKFFRNERNVLSGSVVWSR
ncbi:hypothetical protein SAMN02927923_02651 [Microvirga guangxiensis]|uniref:Uncharacterized protein n=1 Tax=Microvirga guangxiensis TaxID=549386 RepID=A0A1G5JI19_9HYPH|nr:hypothetical protein SAMN02927923_02651 [Microvirga guangxiensis]